ncbi:prealbumin-like fold domain-containing protein [Clostridium sp.]|uniref:prealbumin-like fold domain-containing protein n=1 Tax=Clostridium sp. TaxID=1506 RepID=UPI00261EE46B|nr:prealbumin-like fold domain-containing protein [Clostridium sp.]
MNEIVSSRDNHRVTEGINHIVSSGNNEIKYCESNDENYEFKAVEHKEIEQEKIVDANLEKIEDKKFNNGEIEVTSILDCGENEYLQGVKINLYKINGLSPVLIKSKITDEEGRAVFSEIEEGCYRVIEIIDKRYFEKPKYINWNEIIIDNVNKNQKIVIVNKIKRSEAQNKHKHLV